MTKQSLSGAWKLRAEFIDIDVSRFNEVLSRPEGKFEILGQNWLLHGTPFPKREGFIDANVPCDVITALTDNGIIPEPLEKDNTERLLWLQDLSWWFIRDFEVSEELFAHEQIRLYIDMLDFKANIILNGVPAFEHKNAFVPFNEDIRRFLRAGKNQIIIRLTSGLEDGYSAADSMSYYAANGNRTYRTFMRKPAYTFGWDWCRPIPTCGIGRAIYLEGLSGAKITAFRADTLAISRGDAKLNAHFEIDNISVTSADETILRYAISYNGKTVYEAEKNLYLPGGLNYFEEEIEIKGARLWWPNGYGEQNLYTVKASVECRNALNTMQEKLIGIRTITIDHSKRSDGTRNFRFVVNGVPVYCKGGNWVPTDSVYMRTPDSTYQTLVEEAKEQHFTMLRMWGGGVYEPDFFYDQCSKNGIMLMHDFMYACAYYPDYNDAFMYEAEKEAQYQTRRLAHHACMAVWTGNNEVHESYTDWFSAETNPVYFYGYKIFNYTQAKAVRDNSPCIPYMPSSPFFGKTANDPFAGDVHAWKIIDKLQNPEKLPREQIMDKPRDFIIFDKLAELARFSSEYGFHGPLQRSSVERHHAGEPVSFDSVSWKHHEGGAMRSLKETYLKKQVSHHLVPAETLDEDGYLLYAGLMHGINYRELMEALRRREHTSGGLIWMYNDCWPETGWTTVDYYLTRKIAFYFLKRAFSPKKFIIRVFDGRASIVALNETPEDLEVNVEYGYMSFEGKTSGVKTVSLSMKKHSFNELPAFAAPGDLVNGFYFARATGNADIAPATSLRGNYRDYKFADFKAAIVSEKPDGDDYLVTLKSETYIPFVQLVCDDDRTRLSDNYFELIPGSEKTVRIHHYGKTPELRLIELG
jgi:beta-mannosidase